MSDRAQVSPFPVLPVILVVAVAVGFVFESVLVDMGFAGGPGAIAAGAIVGLVVYAGSMLALERAVNRASP